MNDIQRKIDELIDHYRYATKVAEALGVSRMALANWRDGKVEISDENRTRVEMLHAEKIVVPSLTKGDTDRVVKEILRTDFSPWLENFDIVTEISRQNAFGSLEIELDVGPEEFDNAMTETVIEKDIERSRYLQMVNLGNLTMRIIEESLEGRIGPIGIGTIKEWHYALFQGVRRDAGRFSTHMRIIPAVDIPLTHPEDIEEEMALWVREFAEAENLFSIAKGHESFELIHPFGDGNGRVGRLIMVCQCTKQGLLPPLIDKQNKALYYSVLKSAQLEGNINALTWFLARSILRQKERLERAKKRR
ncbi:Fic family protein [Hydrogenimonas sp.]